MANDVREISQIQVTCQAADILPLEALMDFQGGIKTISATNLEKLKQRIISDGINVPVFVWAHDGINHLLDGHQRRAALMALEADGYDIPPVPVAYIEAVDEADARQKLLGITSQYGEFDTDELSEWLDGVSESVADTLRLVDGEIDLDLSTGLEEETEGDDEVPDSAPPVTELGDLWEIGRHRLLCGDSTDPDQYGVLFDGLKADMLFTDPPYGVEVVGGSKDPRSKDFATGGTIQNDDLTGESLREFVFKALSAAAPTMADGCVYYIAHPDIFSYEFVGAVRDCGWKQARPPTIQWIKDSAVFGRGDYHSKTEPILYGWKPGAAHSKVLDRKQTNCWEIPRPRKSEEHPTMKPVALVEQAIKNHSVGIILDNFLGSGTTIIAAERTNRTCYGLELDPHYCDVIVTRYRQWCEANDRDAVILRNGEPYDA